MNAEAEVVVIWHGRTTLPVASADTGVPSGSAGPPDPDICAGVSADDEGILEGPALAGVSTV